VTVYRFAGRSRFQQFRGPTQAQRLVGRTERLVGGLNLLRLARDDSMDFVAWRASNQLCIVAAPGVFFFFLMELRVLVSSSAATAMGMGPRT
jgi:hypothetical protein